MAHWHNWENKLESRDAALWKFLRNEGSAFALQTARPFVGGPRKMATPSWVVDVKMVSSISTSVLNTLTLKLSAFFGGTFGLSFWIFGRQRNIPVVILKPLNPKIDQHQFSHKNISRSSRVQVMRNTNLITKERNALVIYQVPSTHSSRQCKDTSVENLYLDTGD